MDKRPGPGKKKLVYNIHVPGRNTHKVFIEDHFYHIYNRGWNRSELFLDDGDYIYFESLLERHLSA